MFKIRALAATAALLCGSQAMAGLIGDTVGARYVGAGDTGVVNSVVGAGEEGNFFGNQFFDFGDSSFTIRSSSGAFCGVWACSGPIQLELTSLDMGSPITNVMFSTNLTGVSVAYTADSVTFSWMEQSLPFGTYITADFVTGRVPVPGSLLLAGLGLGAAAFVRRRAAQQAA